MHFRFLAASLVIAFAPLGWTQEQLGNKAEIDAVFGKNRETMNKLINGSTPPTTADAELLDAMAKNFVYRFSWATVRNDSKAMVELTTEIQTTIDRMETVTAVKGNREFVAKLGAPLAKRLKELFEKDFDAYKSSQINAAATFSQFSRLKQEEVAELFTDLVGNEKVHLIVRMYAAENMAPYFPLRMGDESTEDPKNAKVMARKTRDVKRVDSLVKFIEQDWAKPMGENKLDKSAIPLLRKKAIDSLGQAQIPAVFFSSKGKVVEGLVAPTLVKVLVKGGITPEPTLQEKISATVGLCQIKSMNSPEYIPDVAVYLNGKTILEFLDYYTGDYPNFTVKTGKKPPMLFVKTEAKRLELALKEQTLYSKGTTAAKNAADLEREMFPQLQKAFQYNPVDRDGLVGIRNKVQAMRPKDGNLFKSLKLAPVDLD